MNTMNELRRIEIKSSPFFCVITESSGLNLDISLSCSVLYDYKIDNRLIYSRIFGMDSEYMNKAFEAYLQKETDSILQIAFAKVSQTMQSYQEIQQSGSAVKEELAAQLAEWGKMYGVEFCDIEVSDIRASKEDAKKISEFANCLEKTLPNVTAKEISPWRCSCGTMSNRRFCPECGKKRPEKPKDGWNCIRCGTANHGKFCTECGNAFEIIMY